MPAPVRPASLTAIAVAQLVLALYVIGADLLFLPVLLRVSPDLREVMALAYVSAIAVQGVSAAAALGLWFGKIPALDGVFFVYGFSLAEAVSLTGGGGNAFKPLTEIIVILGLFAVFIIHRGIHAYLGIERVGVVRSVGLAATAGVLCSVGLSLLMS
jgi:hypothetical protein